MKYLCLGFILDLLRLLASNVFFGNQHLYYVNISLMFCYDKFVCGTGKVNFFFKY